MLHKKGIVFISGQFTRLFHSIHDCFDSQEHNSVNWKMLQNDLQELNDSRNATSRNVLSNYVNNEELAHMESPEADEAFTRKLDEKVQTFFENIPLPADPMRAALAPTEEELEENASADAVKEAMREAYKQRQRSKIAEQERIEKAMEKYTQNNNSILARRTANEEKNNNKRDEVNDTSETCNRGGESIDCEEIANDEIKSKEELREELKQLNERAQKLRRILNKREEEEVAKEEEQE